MNNFLKRLEKFLSNLIFRVFKKSNFAEKLKAFLHDPIDKCFDIKGHEKKAEKYAKLIGVSNFSRTERPKGPDMIASCMERSLLPKHSEEQEFIAQDFNEIRHPLSEGYLRVSNIDPNDAFNSIGETYKQIGEQIKNWDDKKKFFFLWRNLQDRIFIKAENKDWVKYLPILPADTRVPDHSIWEHLKIASSVSAFWDGKTLIQNNSLFLFTIGPVQSFIAQARKTRDFYMGSFILSFLTFKAMEVIIDEFGPTNIIYPDLYKQPLVDWWIKKNLNIDPVGFNTEDVQLPTIPNRFVAILPLNNKEDIVKQMEEKIKNTIKEAKETIFSKRGLKLDISNEIRGKIDSQLSEFPEIYWVAIPWKIKGRDISYSDFENILDNDIVKKYEDLWNFADKEGEFKPNIGLLYELIYSVLERFMGARKNVRTFKQPNVEEKGRKCSVCGERDVIFFKETKNKSKFTRYNNLVVDLTDENIPPKFIADGEGLCAICFLKRTFEIYLKEKVSEVFKDLSFPSTAEIACADFKEKMLLNEKNEYQKYLEKFKSKFKSLLGNQFVRPLDKIKDSLGELENLEGAWFYEENLTEKYIRDELGTSIGPSGIEELRNLLKEITNKVGKPNPYYALIYLDGDNMGKWLSGELLPEIKHAYASETWEKKLRDDFKNEIKNKRPKKLLTPAIHASISTALRNYALEFVRKIVEEEHLGKLVYAGGDDVLAFVNLRDLLDVIHKLRWAFSGNVKINSDGKIEVDLDNKTGFVEKDGRYLLTMGPNASASMGIVI
ncbi:MAG: type III-B CRISPR-associated protein Cas10/Cmr2, partial [candidate division WOR-3 bacterium]|nr:type III-B CRISPR-associated protein Cas10/Cmr2 [candidate division WOR-3 bacterium]